MRRADRLERVMSPLRHELRNTLSPITMVVDMLAIRGDDPELAVLSRGIQVLALHVDDLASLSRESHGDLAIALQPVELSTVVTSAVEGVSRHLAQTATALDVRVPAKVYVRADPMCLALALGSALRHCALVSRELVLTTERDAKTVIVRIAVGDRGLPPEGALVFARGLLELQNGTCTLGDGLRISLPAASIR